MCQRQFSDLYGCTVNIFENILVSGENTLKNRGEIQSVTYPHMLLKEFSVKLSNSSVSLQLS